MAFVIRNHDILLLDKIPVSIPDDQRVLVMFDIDGVTCDDKVTNLGNYDELPKEEIDRILRECKITPQFSKTITALRQLPNVDIKFNTGRRESMMGITQEMFDEAGLDFDVKRDVKFFPNEFKWFTDDYNIIKSKVLKEGADEYDLSYYIDDSNDLINYINENYKDDIENKKILPFLFKYE